MILALALLAGCAVVGWIAPRYLHKLTSSRVHPVLAIAWWLLTCLGVALTTVASVVVMLLPEHGPTRRVLGWIDGCWSSMTHGDLPQFDDVIGLTGTAITLAVAIRVGVAALRRRAQALRVHRKQLDLLRLVARKVPGPIPVLWLEHSRPLAYSVAGNPSFVVATSGLSTQLSKRQVSAVLAHESAHVRGRHHLVVGMAEAMAWALPFVPLMRQAPTAIRVLVEIAADHEAAREHGARTVRRALLRIGACGTPEGALGMADDRDTTLRLERLARNKPTGRVRRLAGFAAATVAASSLPGLVALGFLGVAAMFSCPYF